MREESKGLVRTLRERDELAKALADEYEKMPKEVKRSSYVNRILDIIKNVNKQKAEIDRILKDVQVHHLAHTHTHAHAHAHAHTHTQYKCVPLRFSRRQFGNGGSPGHTPEKFLTARARLLRRHAHRPRMLGRPRAAGGPLGLWMQGSQGVWFVDSGERIPESLRQDGRGTRKRSRPTAVWIGVADSAVVVAGATKEMTCR